MYLTPWSRVIIEKLIVVKIVQKFLSFYGTLRFISVYALWN
jgi:hypothetical protein